MKTPALHYLLAAMVLGAVCGCHPHGHEHESEPSEEQHEHGHIVISPERQEQLGIAVEAVQPGPFREVIRTSGQILPAAGEEMTVVARSEGIISIGSLTQGSPVSKGGRIATLSTRSVGSGDRLAKAEIDLETARKEYERDQQLREGNIVSESHLDLSRQAYEHAKIEYEALAAGSTPEGGLAVTAPISGFIKDWLVASGDYVQTGTPVAVVSSNRRLRLQADVPESYFDRIAAIRDANFSTAYHDRTYSMSELGGRVISHGRASNGDFYIPVIFEFDNRGGIVSGSYAEVWLQADRTGDCLSVPLTAVVEDQGVQYVFVREADDTDCFERREVVLGLSDGRRVPVLQGLQAGEDVVTRGAVHVKLAGISAVPAGHTHNH
ncbi:MAG: efflux RND transporter periplasmic adaptor subunit [Bacteroidales bacterium]|nr:efflux RND transporter periplasmic adaptor subunit [Bacteroidales bacterium]